jgi:hypothetical protein
MRTKYYIFLIVFFVPFICCAQDIINDSIPKSYQLKQPQYSAWKTVYDTWMKSEYGKILKQNKLKMNCNGCENIFMDAIFTIDDKGELKNHTLIKSKKCAGEFSKKLELQFINWFQNTTFPTELFNLKFEVRLGTGLKC